MFNGKVLLTLVATASLLSVAVAQGDSRGHGGRPQGEARVFRESPGIFQLPEVQRELKLDGTQSKKIREIYNNTTVDVNGGKEARQQYRAQIDAQLKATLSADQYKRYRELELQHAGPLALMRPEVAKEVGVTDEQAQEMRARAEKIRTAMGKALEGQRGNPEEARKMSDAYMDRMKNSILMVLTPAQKETWTKLQGKPFTFERTDRPS